VVTTVDLDNLATRKPSASLQSYQEILATQAAQEHEANIRAAQRTLRAVRRHTLIPTTTSRTDDTNSTLDSDTTLSDDTTSTSSQQHTLQPPTRMGLPSDFPLFSGDPDDNGAEKPSTWLKRLERTWKPTTSNGDKLYDFEMSLDTDSPAEDW
jgi:hypothetical protein